MCFHLFPSFPDQLPVRSMRSAPWLGRFRVPAALRASVTAKKIFDKNGAPGAAGPCPRSCQGEFCPPDGENGIIGTIPLTLREVLPAARPCGNPPAARRLVPNSLLVPAAAAPCLFSCNEAAWWGSMPASVAFWRRLALPWAWQLLYPSTSNSLAAISKMT